MRVGFDLDGVGYAFETALYDYLAKSVHAEKYPAAGLPTRRWEFYEDWGMSLEQFLDLCHEAADAGHIFYAGGCLDNFPAAVRKVKNLGHSVHIITDRAFGSSPEVSQDLTRLWLKEHDVLYDSLTFSADKTIVPTDVFVEDKLANYDALEAVGTYTYLVNRPWNQDPFGKRRRRIKSVEEYASLVESWTYLNRSL